MLTSYKSNGGTLHQITVHFSAGVAQLTSQCTVQCTLHSMVFFYCTLRQPKDIAMDHGKLAPYHLIRWVKNAQFHIWRWLNEAMALSCHQRDMQIGGDSVMVWRHVLLEFTRKISENFAPLCLRFLAIIICTSRIIPHHHKWFMANAKLVLGTITWVPGAPLVSVLIRFKPNWASIEYFADLTKFSTVIPNTYNWYIDGPGICLDGCTCIMIPVSIDSRPCHIATLIEMKWAALYY